MEFGLFSWEDMIVDTSNPREMWPQWKNNETYEEHNSYLKQEKSNGPHRPRIRIKHNKYHLRERERRDTSSLTVKQKWVVIKKNEWKSLDLKYIDIFILLLFFSLD